MSLLFTVYMVGACATAFIVGALTEGPQISGEGTGRAVFIIACWPLAAAVVVIFGVPAYLFHYGQKLAQRRRNRKLATQDVVATTYRDAWK